MAIADVLNPSAELPHVMDETVFVSSQGGTMLVTDSNRNEVFALQSALFTPGAAYIGSPDSNYLALLNTSNGDLTQVVTDINAHGEAFLTVPEPGALALALGASTTALSVIARRRRRS